MVSEEVDDVTWLKDSPERGDYLVYFDPLDGSSNLEVDLSVGSIFSIMEIENIENSKNVMRNGKDQICAGYAIYGPSTMLVLTMGDHVEGFTFCESDNTFYLTQPEISIAEDSTEFAINASRSRYWSEPIRRYVDECLLGKEGPRARNFNMRWTASMVAEVHRILIRGGVFMYPSDVENSVMGGKLRLLYEANPMSAIVEAAGGASSTGTQRILDLTPSDHHQRVPVILGSKNEVDRIVSYHKSSLNN